MGFKPQTAGLPLVNVPHRPDRENVAMAIGVAVFLFLGIAGVICASLLA